MTRRLRIGLLATLFLLASVAPAPRASAQDWSLIKGGKKEGDKGKKGKKGKKKGTLAKGKKGKKNPPPGPGEPEPEPEGPLTPAQARVADILKMLLVDPSDDYLVEHYVLESRAIDEGPAGSLALIAETYPAMVADPQWPMAKARIMLEIGQTDVALELLEQVHAASPDQAAPAFFLALALEKSGKLDRARKLLAEALASSSSSKVGSLRGRILAEVVAAAVAAGDVNDATAHFASLCAETWELPESFEEILALYAIEDDEDGAIAFVQAVIDARKWGGYEKYYLLFAKAQLLERAERDDEALDELEKALKAFTPGVGGCVDLVDMVFDVAGESQGLSLLLKAQKDPCFYINAALNLEQGGKVEEALDLVAKGAKKFPKDMDLFMTRIEMMIRDGEVHQTIALLRGKAKSKDADPLVVVKLAEVLFETGDRNEAIEVLSKLGTKSKNPAVHEVLEQFYDSVSEPALAKKENELLVKLMPGDPEHLVRLGERLYSEGKVKEAIELWGKIPDLYPGKAEGLIRMADVLFDHSSYSEAESAYKKAVDDGGAGTEAMRKIALYYDLVNNVKAAETWWRLILDSPDASFGMKRESAVRLVQLWQRTYTLGKQLPLAEKMLEDEPGRIEIALLLATMYLELGKQNECRDVLQGLLVQIGDAARTAAPGEREDLLDAADHVLVTLDRLNRLQKLWAEAMEAFEEAAEIFPDKVAELKLKTAEYAVLAGRHDRAREAIAAALEAAPADLDVNEDAADLLFKIGDIEQASSCLAVIVAKDPSRYEDRFRLSRALVHLERWDEAASKLSDLVEDCPYDYLGSEALSLLATIVGAGHVDMNLEAWLYKLFLSSKGRDFAGRRLIEIYRDRLGGGPRVEKVFTPSAAPEGGAPDDADWMKRAGKAAAKILVEGPDDVRFKALDVLSHVRDPELAGSLLKRASYIKVPGHQVMAIVGISGSLAPEHGPYLVDLVESTSPDVRAAAVLGMAFTGDPALFEEIEKHYFSSAPEVRAAAVLATGLLMARTGQGVDQGASESIMTLLRTRQWRVTYQATILTLGVMGGEESSEQLMNFIASRGRIGTSDKKPAKLKAGDAGSLTMRLALLALAAGSFEGPDVTQALLEGCWSDVDDVRDIAGYALLLETSDPGVVIRPVPSHIPVTQGMRHGSFRVEDILEKLVSVPDYRFDAETVEALRPRLEEALEARLGMHASASSMDNENVKLLLETLLILDAEEGRTSWLPFSDHLEAGSAAASRAVLDAVVHARLSKLDAIMGLVLEGPAASRDPALVGLASVMGKIGGTAPPASLVELATGQHSGHMTSAAVEALGAFDSAECVEVLKGLLSSKPWSLRVEIVEALASMKTDAAHDLLVIVAGKDKSDAVREAASAALDTP